MDRSGSSGYFRGFLTPCALHLRIHLESAAFVFHMKITTQGITGSLRAACSEPVQRFLACPFSQPKPTPPTRGCLQDTLARSWPIKAGRLPFIMERPTF